jgi:hypothetical protein
MRLVCWSKVLLFAGAGNGGCMANFRASVRNAGRFRMGEGPRRAGRTLEINCDRRSKIFYPCLDGISPPVAFAKDAPDIPTRPSATQRVATMVSTIAHTRCRLGTFNGRNSNFAAARGFRDATADASQASSACPRGAVEMLRLWALSCVRTMAINFRHPGGAP